MNATCALQHFCDYHGPQTLLCTEVKGNIQDSTDTEQENLRAIFSQYVKAENPPSKGDCKVKKFKSIRLLFIGFRQFLFSPVRCHQRKFLSRPSTQQIICYTSRHHRHRIKNYSKIFEMRVFEV